MLYDCQEISHEWQMLHNKTSQFLHARGVISSFFDKTVSFKLETAS